MINRVSLHTFCERLKSSDLFKDSFWALAGSALGKGLSLLAGIAVARFLGKEVYGEYGTIRTTLFYIAIVSTFGFGNCIHFDQKNHSNRNNIVGRIIFSQNKKR